MEGASEPNRRKQSHTEIHGSVKRSHIGIFISILLILTGLIVVQHFELLPIGPQAAGGDIGQEITEDPVGAQVPEDGNEPTNLVSMEKALSARGLYVTMDVFGTPSIFTDVIICAR